MGLDLSIHGRDRKTGQLCGTKYNPNPQEPKLPSTPRGKRRLENKGNKQLPKTDKKVA